MTTPAPALVGKCLRLCGKRHLPGLPCWSGRYVRDLRAATFAHHGRVCWLCGAPDANTIDHVRPRSRGGLDTLENLRPACRTCNIRRGNTPHDPAPVTVHRSPAW